MGRMGLRDLAARWVLGVGRIGLRDLAARRALGVAYLCRQNRVYGLSHQKILHVDVAYLLYIGRMGLMDLINGLV